MYAHDILAAPLEVTGPVTRDLVFVDDDGLLVGIWECAPGVYDEPTADYDEMMFMVSGRVTVVHPEGSLDIAPGTLWTTPRQWPGMWHVHQTVRKLYVIDPRSATPGTLRHLANAHLLDLGEATPRPVVIAGDPRERSVDIATPNRLRGGRVGVHAGRVPVRRDGYDEVFCVLSGRADLHVDDGRVVRAGARVRHPHPGRHHRSVGGARDGAQGVHDHSRPGLTYTPGSGPHGPVRNGVSTMSGSLIGVLIGVAVVLSAARPERQDGASRATSASPPCSASTTARCGRA